MSRLTDSARAAAAAAARRAAAEAARKAAAAAAARAAAKAAAEVARKAAATAAKKVAKPAKDELSTGVGSALRRRGLAASGGNLRPEQLDSSAQRFSINQLHTFREAPTDASPAGGVSSAVSATATGSLGSSQTSGGVGTSAEVSVSATLEENLVRADGFVTFTVGAELSASASGSVDFRALSLGGSVEAGARGEFTVRLREEDFERLQNGEIPVPNPLNPDTVPDGGSVRVDQSTFTGFGLDVGFETHGVELSVGSDLEESTGTSLLVQRDGGDVRVTAGPTETLSRADRVAVGIGGVLEVSAGTQVSRSEVHLRSATFPIDSAPGARAFERFARTGVVPSEARPGVEDPASVHSVDTDVRRDLAVGLFGVQFFSANLEDSSYSLDITERADGSRSGRAVFDYGDQEVTITGAYGEDGFDPNDFHASIRLDDLDEGIRNNLGLAFAGFEGAEEIAQSDGAVVLEFSADQLAALQDQIQTYGADQDAPSVPLEVVSASADPLAFLVDLTAHTFSVNNYADLLAHVFTSDSNGQNPLPGTLSVED
ncbi:MAG: hypothetical protein H6Q89_3950 [Myxococcaceae bacterium]|nr:hypothetical protein [Myxococcaceae bacterium]